MASKRQPEDVLAADPLRELVAKWRKEAGCKHLSAAAYAGQRKWGQAHEAWGQAGGEENERE